MAFLSTFGAWWISHDGLIEMEDAVSVRRGGRRVKIVRARMAGRRTYKLRTDGEDSRVRDPHGAQMWRVPEMGEPSAVDDWMNYGTDIKLDPDTGECFVVTEARQLPAEWDSLSATEEEDMPQ